MSGVKWIHKLVRVNKKCIVHIAFSVASAESNGIDRNSNDTEWLEIDLFLYIVSKWISIYYTECILHNK